MKKIIVLLIFTLSALAFAKNSNLYLTKSDIFIVSESQKELVQDGNGFHLYVKKTGDIKSIMLIQHNDTVKSPINVLRATSYNKINGDEFFRTNGRKMKFSYLKTQYSLIATKTENHKSLGECFHIYVPQKVYYGFDSNAKIEDFSFKNLKIRAFEKKSCDYSGSYLDYDFSGSDDVRSEIAFLEIASLTDGKLTHIDSVSELTKKLVEEIEEFETQKKIELVFAIDATDSMKDDFLELRKNWLPKFEKQIMQFSDIKLGLLFYKDYGDEFNSNGLPIKNLGFQKDFSSFSKAVRSVLVKGGGDREEAVFEALYSCAIGFDWNDSAIKKIILIGDAPPHSKNLDGFAHNFTEITEILSENNISTDCFLITNPSEKVDKMKSVEKSRTSEELLKSVDGIYAK